MNSGDLIDDYESVIPKIVDEELQTTTGKKQMEE